MIGVLKDLLLIHEGPWDVLDEEGNLAPLPPGGVFGDHDVVLRNGYYMARAEADRGAAADAARAALFADKPPVPANTNSIIALREEVELLTEKVNLILAEMR